MYFENIVFDATDPQGLGRYWENALGTEQLTDEPAGYETRLAVPDGPVLDLCFQKVEEEPTGPQRLSLELREGAGQAYDGTGPLAEISLEVADPDRELDFWSWLSGWEPVAGSASLRHRSQRGPVLRLRAEAEPKGSGKNRIHLDIRLEPGDDPDEIASEVARRGGREVDFGWGDLPWRHFRDPSGNEFCLLPARRS
ncbi:MULTISPECIES: VOC family protein [unclassified Nocardioides]|uniref:VOC family protein n=1 Tax=unclassified Nocardioides TaxID=2615069 RepID=UPI00361FF5BA